MKTLCQLCACYCLWGVAAIATAQETSPPPPSLPQALGLQVFVPPADRRVDLLKADFPQGIWSHYSTKKDSPLGETWTVQVDPETSQPILVCKGEPNGYLRTVKEFKDFELSMEWRFPKENSGNNSGILLFTAGEDKIWPTSLQVQLYQPEVGRILPHGVAKAGNELRDVPSAAKPVGSWNRCQIICRNGTIQVTVNSKELGEVTGCQPSAGAIALQSEGSEIHFRNVLLRELPSQPLTSLSPDQVKAPGADGTALVRGNNVNRHPEIP